MAPRNYSKFRSGVTFKEVRRELACEQSVALARDERMYVTRRTVLGRMRQHKQEAFRHYCWHGAAC